MKVIEYEERSWYFLSNGNDFYIDVNGNVSSAGFSLLIKLDDAELIAFNKEGKAYLNILAEDIQYYAESKYVARNVVGDTANQSYEAIMAFNRESGIR